MATPADAPAVTVRPRNTKVSRSMACSSAAALALGVGLAEIPQQQRELVAAEPADHVG